MFALTSKRPPKSHRDTSDSLVTPVLYKRVTGRKNMPKQVAKTRIQRVSVSKK